MKTKHPPTAYAYARTSDPEQRKGGGLVRQTTCKEALEEFCRRHEFTLSPHIYVDDGVPAFEGANATAKHQLGQFLQDARQGRVRPGDCLLVENYDRLSRQSPWAAIGLVN